MNNSQKIKLLSIAQVIFCAVGLALMWISRSSDDSSNLFMIGSAINGIGIVTFLYTQNAMKKG